MLWKSLFGKCKQVCCYQPQVIFTCSKSAIETLEKGVNYVHS